jgi:hypothetical protein
MMKKDIVAAFGDTSVFDNAVRELTMHPSGDCIYCVAFEHGVTKVGKARDLASRLKQMATHGILAPLFSWVEFRQVTASLSSAERFALGGFSAVSRRLAPEVFVSVERGVAVDILSQAAKDAAQQHPIGTPPTIAEYPEIAESSRLTRAFEYLARDKRHAESVAEAIYFIDTVAVGGEAVTEDEYAAQYVKLHPFAAELVPVYLSALRDYVLAGNNFSGRRAFLERFAAQCKTSIPALNDVE